MVRQGNLKYVMRLYEEDQLYDLAIDPMETVNRIDDPAYAEDAERLRARLLRFYMETADYVPPRFDKREPDGLSGQEKGPRLALSQGARRSP